MKLVLKWNLSAAKHFLAALDWNRAMGRRDLPRDIVRIVFDLACGHALHLYYLSQLVHITDKLEANAQTRQNRIFRPERYNSTINYYSSSLKELDYTIARYSRYSNVLRVASDTVRGLMVRIK